MKPIPLAAEFIYLATSAECAGPINQYIAVNNLKLFVLESILPAILNIAIIADIK